MFRKVGTFGLGLSVIRGQDAISIMMMMTIFFSQLMASLSSKKKVVQCFGSLQVLQLHLVCEWETRISQGLLPKRLLDRRDQVLKVT